MSSDFNKKNFKKFYFTEKNDKTLRDSNFTIKLPFRTVSMISNGLQWDVDEHVYVTYQNSASGIVGMAWVGSTCSIYQFYRSNINEWFRTDTIAAQVS